MLNPLLLCYTLSPFGDKIEFWATSETACPGEVTGEFFHSSPPPLLAKAGSSPRSSVFYMPSAEASGITTRSFELGNFIEDIQNGRTKEGQVENRRGRPGRGREHKGIIVIGK